MRSESREIPYEVFGIGSAQGADQVGWQVLDRLLDPWHCNPARLHRLESPVDLLGFAAALRIDERATQTWVLVDACLGESVGKVHGWRWPAVPVSALPVLGVSSHGIGLIDALRLGQELAILPEFVWIYGIEIGEFQSIQCDRSYGIDWEPNPQCQAAIASCAAQIASRSLAIQIASNH